MLALYTLTYYILILFIIFISGSLFTSLLVPLKFKEYKYYFTFIFGFTWLILISTWVSYLGFSFKESANYILIVSIMMFSLSVYNEIRKKAIGDWKIDKRKSLVLGLAFISGVLVLSPVTLFNSIVPYTDGFTYISIADYLTEYSYFDPAKPDQYYPWLTQMKLYQDEGYRMGAQFFLAFVTTILMRPFSMEVLMPTIGAGIFILALSTWLFNRVGLNIPIIASFFALVFVAFHANIPISLGIDGFLPQIFGMSLMLIPFTLILRIEDWTTVNRPFYVGLMALSFSALIISYSEMIPFIGLSCSLVLILKIINNKNSRNEIIKNILLSAIFTSLLSNIAIVKAFNAILSQMNAIVGWHVPYTLWDYIQYSLSTIIPMANYEFYYNNYPLIYIGLNILTLLVIAAVGYGIVALKTDNDFSLNRIYLVALFMSYTIVFIYFIFFSENPWIEGQRGHSWSIYKLVQYSFWILPTLVGMGIYKYMKVNSRLKSISIAFVVIYILVNTIFVIGYSYNRTEPMRDFTGDRENPLTEYYELYNKYKDTEQTINLVMDEDSIHKHRQMIAYMLKKNKLISDWSNDVYVSMNTIPYDKEGIYLQYNSHAKDKVANMTTVKKIQVNFADGFYAQEQNEEKEWRWSSGEGCLRILNISNEFEEIILNFTIGLPPGITDSQQLSIIQNKEVIERLIMKPNQITNYNLEIKVPSGESEIKFVFDGQSIKVGSDPRDLAFSLIDFKYDTK